jgi:huntingtin interacting protein 1
LNLLASIKDRNKADDVAGNVAAVKSRVAEVAELIEKLTNVLQGDSAEVIGDLVESELASMDKAIEEAANRIEVSVKCLVWKCCIYI